MQPIATDGVASVVCHCQSVCLSRLSALQKWLNRSRCSLRLWLGWPKEPYVGGPDPHMWSSNFEGEMGPAEYIPRHVWWSIYSKRGRTSMIRWDHIGATWQIQLNRPCTVAMRPYIKLLWPVLLLLYHSAWSRIWVFLQYFAKISWYHWSGRTKGISDSTVMTRITYCTCSRLH